jgi:hypothetical protein
VLPKLIAVAAVVAIAAFLLVRPPAAAEEHDEDLTELARAGAPLIPSTPSPSAFTEPVTDSPARPVAEPVSFRAPATPASELAPGSAGLATGPGNPIDLFSALDPRKWAGDLLDAVVTMLGRALLEAVRGFTDWALGFGDSSLNFVTRTPPEGSYESATVRSLWDLSRGVTNGALAVLVMWGGLNVIVKESIRSPYHGAMELLPRVAVAAIAANLTLEFARLLIDLNNAFTAAVGAEALPGYDQAGAEQEGLALVLVAVAYALVALLLVFQMLMRLALLDVLIVLAPVMVLLWVLPQTQGWTRWWTHLFPITVFQQAVQMVVLRLGAALMVELTPGSVANAVLTLLLGIAVCWLTLKVPSLLRGQVHHAGMSSVVSLVVLGHAAGSLAGRGGSAAAAAGAGR